MVLVDVNAVNQSNGSAVVNVDKTNETLTKAITSLANSAVFNRTFYGPNTISISRLHGELGELLDRDDLDASSKLKLYTQGLQRFLFLQRESEKKPPVTPVTTVASNNLNNSSSSSFIRAPSPEASGRNSPERPETPPPPQLSQPIASSTPMQISTSSPGPSSSSNQVEVGGAVGGEPRFKNNLPRTTPKEDYLRKNRKRKHMSSFFYNWNKKKKQYE